MLAGRQTGREPGTHQRSENVLVAAFHLCLLLSKFPQNKWQNNCKIYNCFKPLSRRNKISHRLSLTIFFSKILFYKYDIFEETIFSRMHFVFLFNQSVSQRKWNANKKERKNIRRALGSWLRWLTTGSLKFEGGSLEIDR